MYDIEKTEATIANEELSRMSATASSALAQLRNKSQQAYNAFWFGQVSPIVKIELLGTQAIKVFTDSADAQVFLASKIEGYEPLTIPEGYEIAFNQDGSATITGEYTGPTRDFI